MSNERTFAEHFPTFEKISQLKLRKAALNAKLKEINNELEYLRKQVAVEEMLNKQITSLPCADGRRFTLKQQLSVKCPNWQQFRNWINANGYEDALTVHHTRLPKFVREHVIELLKSAGHEEPEIADIADTKEIDNKDIQKYLDEDELKALNDTFGLEISPFFTVDGGDYKQDSIIPDDLQDLYAELTQKQDEGEPF